VPQPQTYANHVRFEPLFHYVAFPILAFHFFWSLYDVFSSPSAHGIRGVAVAIALILVALYARIFALRAQDRVIRLEMQLRLRELLPSALLPRIHDFTPGQLVALRFASDAELPTLAARVLADNIQDKKTIKQLITDWKPDHLRV